MRDKRTPKDICGEASEASEAMTLVELHFAKKETAFVFDECFEYLPYTRLQVLLS